MDRRTFGGAGVAAAACATLPRPLWAAPGRARSPIEEFLAVKGALDGKLVIASLSGTYFAIDNGRATPLLGLQSVSYSLYEPQADGSFRHRVAEVEYYTDVVTGAITYAWVNPLTGKPLKLIDRGRNVAEFVVHPDLTITLPKNAGFRQAVTSVRRDGNDIWYEQQSSYTPKAGEAALPSTELVTFHARNADLRPSDGRRVPTEVYYSVFTAWRPWMEMGTRPGNLLLRGRGLAKITTDQLPKQWVDRTREYWPELLASPERLLRG